ncbi:MAG: methyltransferase domain-containing protein [Saprospiraceae bacterium]|nr:methyltransferase domain-containing protein [Saprospiraceae bacterium]
MIKTLYKRVVPEKMRNNIIISLRRAKAPFLYGNTYKCNCCGWTFRKMLSKAGRENAECPNCAALERTRLLLYYLQNETEVFTQKMKVLHFGPEPSLYKILSKTDNEYIDADYHPAYAHHVIDITNIQYSDDYFDMIICSHVVGYVHDEDKALEELHRVLSPNGLLILLTFVNPESVETIDHEWVNTPELRTIHYGEPECLRLHGVGYKGELEAKGFKVNQLDYRVKLGSEMVKRNALGLGPREWIFECRKK